MFSSFIVILKQKCFLLLGSFFTILLNICLGYRGFTLCCAILAIIFLTLDSLLKADLICKKKEPMKEANDSETLNLRFQSLTADEVKSFSNKLRVTQIDENIKQNLIILKEDLDSLNLKL